MKIRNKQSGEILDVSQKSWAFIYSKSNEFETVKDDTKESVISYDNTVQSEAPVAERT